jgi:hypothetical protein
MLIVGGLVALIAYFTRERSGHNIRHDVREALVTHPQQDHRRGIRS